jgi:hypothetical protein
MNGGILGLSDGCAGALGAGLSLDGVEEGGVLDGVDVKSELGELLPGVEAYKPNVGRQLISTTAATRTGQILFPFVMESPKKLGSLCCGLDLFERSSFSSSQPVRHRQFKSHRYPTYPLIFY